MSWLAYLKILATIYAKRVANHLPFFKHHQYVTFVILCHPRTGSTLLHTLLNSHLRVLSLGETIMNDFVIASSKESIEDERVVHRAAQKEYSRLIRAVGCKLFYRHGSGMLGERLLRLLTQKKAVKIIHLYRENILRTVVSFEIAKKTKQSTFWQSRQYIAFEQKKVRIEPTQCIAMMSDIQDQFEKHQKIIQNLSTLLVSYESLLTDYNNTTVAIQKFIGVKPTSLRSLLRKQNAESLSQLIDNYDEVKGALLGTIWERYINE